MKKELNLFIILALLCQSQVAFAQDESLSDEDLETLLNDEGGEVPAAKPAPATPSAQAPAPDPTPVVEATPAPAPTPEPAPKFESVDVNPTSPTESTITEPVSSETVDLDELDQLEKDTEEKMTPEVKPEVAKPEPKSEPAPEPKVDEVETAKKDTEEKTPEVETVKTAPDINSPTVFDVGREERELLSMAQNIQGQISNDDWNEMATAAKVDSYTVVKDDWLFKISKKIFGTGYYYPKIWSLNTFITNPHTIEPGMVLSFTTGSGTSTPEFKLGAFSEDELNSKPGSISNANPSDLNNFGEGAKPAWLDEKQVLADQGVYFQYASDETMDDLSLLSEQALNREYENYEPPRSEFEIVLPKNYDKTGFDKSSKIFFSFKEGFYLSTFVSTNIVQDFGHIANGPDENIFFLNTDHAYVKFDEAINVLPGDKFSIYTSSGKVKHANSDREGYKYTIVGHVKVIRKVSKDKWEVEVFEVSGTPQRGDRITAYTPKIDRITRTHNSRLVEAGILSTFLPNKTLLATGDVLYLDRGRADGVEMGNVFEVFGFKDRATKKAISNQPTYKMGELVVITLTDNFATVLVSKANRDFYTGDIAITKTKDAYLKEMQALKSKSAGEKDLMGGKALEELDVELNLDNVNDDLLKQADKIQLTEDELAELERQEREKSVIKDSERDLKSLERLEKEIESAESILNDAKLDEDKLLENQNLNDIEKKGGTDEDSLDEIEENLGKRYLDEDLNSKDNPFGLTEFDVEEVDELLNTEKKQQDK